MSKESFSKMFYGAKATLEIGVGDWGMAILVVLVALSCFGLGRLSALQAQKVPINITQAAAVGQALAIGGMYEASKDGTLYFFPWCGGAQSIQPEDQVWFKTEAAAQKAGYAPAKNCKGLSN